MYLTVCVCESCGFLGQRVNAGCRNAQRGALGFARASYPPGKWRGYAVCLGTLKIRSRMKRRRSVTPESVAAEKTHGRGNRPIYGTVAQQADAAASKAEKYRFKSCPCHQPYH